MFDSIAAVWRHKMQRDWNYYDFFIINIEICIDWIPLKQMHNLW